jgi:hypothetical protein
MSFVDDLFGLNKQADALKQQKKMAWESYLLGKEYSDTQYGLQTNQAVTSGALATRRLNEGLDQSLGQINTGLLAQSYGIQNAQIQTASSTGASLAAEGMGGTRGNAANGLVRAYEEQALDRNIDLQNQQNAQSLTAMMSQANNASQDIRRETESWMPGGYRAQEKAAQDEYNRKMADLGQSNFDWQISAATPGWMDYAGAILGGTSSALGLANSANTFYNLF